MNLKLDSFLTRNARDKSQKNSELELLNLTVDEKDTCNVPTTKTMRQEPMSLSVDRQSRSAMSCIFEPLVDAPKKRDKKQQLKDAELLKISEVVEILDKEDR